jgi:dipeptidyl aminopeptidase/acylaminoacyl peptidase
MRGLALFIAFAATFMPMASRAATIDFQDLRGIVAVSNAEISPDGTRVLFMRGRADYDRDRRVSQLMLFDLRTHRMRPLTFEREGVSSPQWAPDGRRIAFLAPAKHDEKSEEHDQVFAMRLDGGDAQKITDAANGVDGFAWSPSGDRIAYIAQDPDPNQKQIDAHLDAFEVGDNDYLHTQAAMPAHLWVVSGNGGRARRLTSGTWSLETVDPSSTSDLTWSPEGRKIAFVRFPTPLYGDTLGSKVDVIDVASGKVEPLTRNAGGENTPAFAPAGDAIAYSRPTGGDFANGNAIYVTHSGSGIDVHAAIDRNINAAVWAPDGKSLWLFGEDGTTSAAWYVTSDAKARAVHLDGIAISGVGKAAKTGAIAFTASTSNHPAEVYYLASPSARPIRLTDFNAAIARRDLGRVVPMTWRSDGFTEDGVLTLPPHYDPQKAYPLALVIHGGPQSASIVAWSSQNQLFASHGYLVFNPNYRGSTNLGDKYEHAIARDAGEGPGRDVMAGVAAVERAYKVDKSRIAVSGWSYGGYMTSWMIGHYGIWKAAVSGAALNDWFDDYNVAFYVDTDVPFFGGPPWDPKYIAMWEAQSPISYVQRVRTPTLIMGDLGDNNVTITNSFKMYHALKDNGVPVEFVAYPVHGHFPSDPVRSEDVTRRWLAWLDRYLK